ncbi:MAG: hypothetical protein KCHDKBKB_02193 [Elusimicrobia bacterium]|nr:hypothetical protein [Elusimicrobiota bacterium]
MSNEQLSVSSSSQPKRVNRFFGQYIIKHHFQFKLSFILLAILSVSTLIIWLESRVAVNKMIEAGFVTGEDAVLQLQSLTSIIGQTGFLIMALTFGLVLFLTHFLAGPIYRFEKIFKEMKEGNLSIFVRLRKHDQMQDLADEFNQGLAGLRSKIKKEREAREGTLNKVEGISKELRSSGNIAQADKLDQAVAELKSQSNQIKIS